MLDLNVTWLSWNKWTQILGGYFMFENPTTIFDMTNILNELLNIAVPTIDLIGIGENLNPRFKLSLNDLLFGSIITYSL